MLNSIYKSDTVIMVTALRHERGISIFLLSCIMRRCRIQGFGSRYISLCCFDKKKIYNLQTHCIFLNDMTILKGTHIMSNWTTGSHLQYLFLFFYFFTVAPTSHRSKVYMPFSQWTFRLTVEGKAQVELLLLMMALFYLTVFNQILSLRDLRTRNTDSKTTTQPTYKNKTSKARQATIK